MSNWPVNELLQSDSRPCRSSERARDLALALTSIAAAFMLGSVPLTEAASASTTSGLVVAPFHGRASSLSQTSVSVCGSARIVSPSKFHLQSGNGSFSGATNQGTCGGSPYVHTTNVTFQVTTLIPLNLSSGFRHFQATWTANFSGTWNVSRGPCRNISGVLGSTTLCGASQYFEVRAFVGIKNTTSGLITYANSSVRPGRGQLDGWYLLYSYSHWCNSTRPCGHSSFGGAPGAGTLNRTGPVYFFENISLSPSYSYTMVTGFNVTILSEVWSVNASRMAGWAASGTLQARANTGGMRLASISWT